MPQTIIIRSPYSYQKQFTDNGFEIIDTTSHNPDPIMRQLSPFYLKLLHSPDILFENYWQYSKLYPMHGEIEYTGGTITIQPSGFPDETITLKQITFSPKYSQWRNKGFADTWAHRYPAGKGAIPTCSVIEMNNRYYAAGYIEARKLIYAPEYTASVIKTIAYRKLHQIDKPIVLLDFDWTDFSKPFTDILNDPKRKMGHATVLAALLTEQYTPAANPAKIIEIRP